MLPNESILKQPLDLMVQLPTRVVILALWVYGAAISPFLGPCCRFSPTCSEYGRHAVGRYGVWRGGWMMLRRVLRCHPFQPGGWDPVV